jgi:hypothetical protein
MAIYQSEYLFMKKHFFSTHELQANQDQEEEAKINNDHPNHVEGGATANGKLANSEAKTKAPTRKRNTKSRRK